MTDILSRGIKGVIKLCPAGVQPDEAALQTYDHCERLVWTLRVGEFAGFTCVADGTQHPHPLVELQFLAPADRTYALRVDLREEVLESLVVEAVTHASDHLTEGDRL